MVNEKRNKVNLAEFVFATTSVVCNNGVVVDGISVAYNVRTNIVYVCPKNIGSKLGYSKAWCSVKLHNKNLMQKDLRVVTLHGRNYVEYTQFVQAYAPMYKAERQSNWWQPFNTAVVATVKTIRERFLSAEAERKEERKANPECTCSSSKAVRKVEQDISEIKDRLLQHSTRISDVNEELDNAVRWIKRIDQRTSKQTSVLNSVIAFLAGIFGSNGVIAKHIVSMFRDTDDAENKQGPRKGGC